MNQGSPDYLDEPTFIINHIMFFAQLFNRRRDFPQSVPRCSREAVMLDMKVQSPVEKVKPNWVRDVDVCQHLSPVPVRNQFFREVELFQRMFSVNAIKL